MWIGSNKENEYVSKGDVLISGLIHKNEEIMKKTYALGVVFCEVWYSVNISAPKVYKETLLRNETKSIKYVLLKMGKKKIQGL